MKVIIYTTSPTSPRDDLEVERNEDMYREGDTLVVLKNGNWKITYNWANVISWDVR